MKHSSLNMRKVGSWAVMGGIDRSLLTVA